MRLFFYLLLGSLLLVPADAFAQFGPIVPEICRVCPCGFGGVLAIIQNVVNFIIGLAVIFATLIIVWGGGLYILSPVNPENRSTANKMLMNAVIGLLIVLSAWLIVDFIMKTLYGGQFGPWNTILLGTEGQACIEENPNLSQLFDGNITSVPGQSTNPGGVTTGSVSTAGGCSGDGTNQSSCVPLAPEVSCSARGCRVDAGLKAALAGIQTSQGWTVTEAYPQSRSHRANCHRNGTCVDAAFRPQNYTAESVAAFASAARNRGIRVVFETDSCTLRDQVRAAGVTAYCKSDGGGYESITGNHFSLYAN